jgi:DNA polymerase III delta prime subunit
VIILDEMEGASNQFFKALKVPLEKFAHCRFIGITNHINEIEEGVLSRFIHINFDPSSAEEERELFGIYEKRSKTLLKKMNVKISDEVNHSFVKKHFPDMRKIISILQHIHISKVEEVTEEILLQHSYSFLDLYDNLVNKPDPVLNYKLICGEYKDRYREVLSSLGDDFLQWLSEKHPEKYKNNIAQIIIEVADWQSKISSMIDPHLGLLACFFKIQNLLNK